MKRGAPDPVERAFSGWIDPRISPSLQGIAAVYGFGPRPLQWDAVVTASAPELTGEEVRFAVGSDGSTRGERAAAAALAPLRRAVCEVLEPPFAAIAVRREGDVWAVAANRAHVVDLPIHGDEISLSRVDGHVTTSVDGEEQSALSLPGLEALIDGDGTVMAHRFAGETWVAETFPL